MPIHSTIAFSSIQSSVVELDTQSEQTDDDLRDETYVPQLQAGSSSESDSNTAIEQDCDSMTRDDRDVMTSAHDFMNREG